MDVKFKEIHKRRKFKSFWECVDYLTSASYDEVDVIMAALDIFEGDICGSVIATDIIKPSSYYKHIDVDLSGSTLVSFDDDDLFANIYLMTDKGNKNYKKLYQAYIDTKAYKPIEQIEDHIKMITIHLKTEIGIKLFRNELTKELINV